MRPKSRVSVVLSKVCKAEAEKIQVAVVRGLHQAVEPAGSAGGKKEGERGEFQGVRFGVGRVDTRTDSDVDGGIYIPRAGVLEEPPSAQLRVRVGAAFESEGDRVGAAVGDGPEEHVQRGGGGEEVFGEEGMETVVGAR